MGIKGLNKLINQYAPSAITQEYISDFKGSKIAIDSELLIHKYRSLDSKNSHIFGFINNVFMYLMNGITPIYVFDGYPSIEKQENALYKRTYHKELLNKKIDELENEFTKRVENHSETISLDPEMNDIIDRLFKVKRKVSYMSISKNYRNECKYLLKLMGIPFIIAEDDAEAYCAMMQLKGLVDYVYTEDTDIIPYFVAGIRNYNYTKPIKILRKGYLDSMVTVIDINKVLSLLDLNHDSFIDMCILSGCDFCTTISKIGPAKAYSYICKWGSIEGIKKYSGLFIPNTFRYQDARNIFYKMREKPITKPLSLIDMDPINLYEYLATERGLIPDPIIERCKNARNAFQLIN